MANSQPVAWTRNRGRNGWDDPLGVGDGWCVECRNIHYYNGGLGTKRGGSTSIGISGATGPINAAVEYIPGQDPTKAELFLVDASTPNKILRGNTGTNSTTLTLTSLTLTDTIRNSPHIFSAVGLNGKLYCAYNPVDGALAVVNRLHVFDPILSTSTLRRAGLAPFAAAATVANTGAGAYPATLRYYKTRNVIQESSITVVRSEANSSVSFTPSGAGTAARITRPTAVGEAETHWEVYGSTDDVTYYGPIATVAIATTTYDDSSTPSTWATSYDAEPVAGFHTPMPAVKYLATNGSRLLGFGVWASSAGDSLTPRDGRVYIGPVLDSSSTHDDERINNTTSLQGWLDVARNSGAVDRGITSRPVNNTFYVFQSVGIYGLIPTENDVTPYRRVVIDSAKGAVNNQSIVLAQDRNGAACAYFLDPTLGPCVLGGSQGLKWCGKDVKDLWDTVNLDATTQVAHGCWYPDRNQVLWWVATGSNNEPTLALALDVTEQEVDEAGDLRGGWSVYDGDFAKARSSVMFSNTVAATRSIKRVPYVGLTAGTFLRYDESVTSDNSTTFQAYATSGALAQDTHALEVKRAYLRGGASSGTTIQQSLVRNFGDETSRTSTVTLTPTGSATLVLKKFEDAALQDGDAVQVTLGDVSAVASAWTLYRWNAEVETGAAL